MRRSGIANRVGRFLAATATRFGYDAVEAKNRRQAPTGRLRSEDKELLPHQRRKLTSAARDIHRNFTIAAWAIRKHLDYVSTFSFQSRTGSADLDGRIEDLMAWWSRPANCDVAGRHSLHPAAAKVPTTGTSRSPSSPGPGRAKRLSAAGGSRCRDRCRPEQSSLTRKRRGPSMPSSSVSHPG